MPALFKRSTFLRDNFPYVAFAIFRRKEKKREKLTSHVLQIEININTSPLFKNSEEIFNSMGEDDENVQVEPGGLENTAVFSVSCPVH